MRLSRTQWLIKMLNIGQNMDQTCSHQSLSTIQHTEDRWRPTLFSMQSAQHLLTLQDSAENSSRPTILNIILDLVRLPWRPDGIQGTLWWSAWQWLLVCLSSYIATEDTQREKWSTKWMYRLSKRSITMYHYLKGTLVRLNDEWGLIIYFYSIC